jgi:hypothetical protein
MRQRLVPRGKRFSRAGDFPRGGVPLTIGLWRGMICNLTNRRRGG